MENVRKTAFIATFFLFSLVYSSTLGLNIWGKEFLLVEKQERMVSTPIYYTANMSALARS